MIQKLSRDWDSSHGRVLSLRTELRLLSAQGRLLGL